MSRFVTFWANLGHVWPNFDIPVIVIADRRSELPSIWSYFGTKFRPSKSICCYCSSAQVLQLRGKLELLTKQTEATGGEADIDAGKEKSSIGCKLSLTLTVYWFRHWYLLSCRQRSSSGLPGRFLRRDGGRHERPVGPRVWYRRRFRWRGRGWDDGGELIILKIDHILVLISVSSLRLPSWIQIQTLR